MVAKRKLCLGLCGIVAGALGPCLAASAMAADAPLWVRQLGTTGSDVAFGVAVGPAGNAYVAGYTTGSLGGPHQGASGTDAWLAKIGAGGTVLWARQLGTEQSDSANAIATDTAANVYVAGDTSGALAGPNRGVADAWLAKVSANGTVVWKRQLGTAADDSAAAVATDATGNIYVAGWTEGAFDGGSSGNRDAWVARFDAAGHLMWRKQIRSAGYDAATGIAADGAGNLYLSGYTNGDFAGPSHGGVYDAWAARIAAATGEIRWKRQLGTDGNDAAQGVATDRAGNVYLAGSTDGSLGGPQLGGGDAWVAKYTASGSRQWLRQFGTPAVEGENGVATDASGNAYLVGYTWGAFGGPSQGGPDAWLAKVDPAGRLVWKRQLGTSDGGDDDENALGVATDANGNVFLTGYTSGPLGGPYRGGFHDAWVAKYDGR